MLKKSLRTLHEGNGGKKWECTTIKFLGSATYAGFQITNPDFETITVVDKLRIVWQVQVHHLVMASFYTAAFTSISTKTLMSCDSVVIDLCTIKY